MSADDILSEHTSEYEVISLLMYKHTHGPALSYCTVDMTLKRQQSFTESEDMQMVKGKADSH